MVFPLSFGFSTTPVSVGFRAFVLALSVLLILVGVSHSRRNEIHVGYFSLVFFYSIYLVRLVYDLSIKEIALSSALQSSTYIYLFAIGSTFLPILAGLPLSGKLDFKKINNIILTISFIQAISIAYIFFQIYGVSLDAIASRHIIATAMEESNIGQPINPIIISRSGGYLALLIVFFKPKRLFYKFIKYCGLVLGIVLLLLGASRGPLLALIISYLLVAFLYILREKKNFKWLIRVGIGFTLLLGLIYFLSLSYKELDINMLDRMISMFDGSQRSSKSEVRTVIWNNAWNQFISSPIVGNKIVENSTLNYPHNLFLEVLMSVGLIGFIPFVISIYYAFKKGFELLFNGYQSVFFLFFFGFISMLFSGSIFLSPEFWVTMVLIFLVKNE